MSVATGVFVDRDDRLIRRRSRPPGRYSTWISTINAWKPRPFLRSPKRVGLPGRAAGTTTAARRVDPASIVESTENAKIKSNFHSVGRDVRNRRIVSLEGDHGMFPVFWAGQGVSDIVREERVFKT